jgi:hypothetical protein
VWHSSIVMDGPRVLLTVGEHVTSTHEAGPQDGYDRPGDSGVAAGRRVRQRPPPRANDGPSTAYRSTLTVRWARLITDRWRLSA